MEDKPKHLTSGTDPYTYAKEEKKAKKEKQDLAQLKNKINATPVGEMKQTAEILPLKPNSDTKVRDDVERNNLRKREHKTLMKSLSLAQKSTASMGQFDRKLKNEPEAAKSQKILKKKSS